VCRYSWHGAGSLGWPFLKLKYKYRLFLNKIHGSNFFEQHSETVMTDGAPYVEITKTLIALFKNKFIVLTLIIFCTLSFPTGETFLSQ